MAYHTPDKMMMIMIELIITEATVPEGDIGLMLLLMMMMMIRRQQDYCKLLKCNLSSHNPLRLPVGSIFILRQE